jgi:hypothetical protein
MSVDDSRNRRLTRVAQVIAVTVVAVIVVGYVLVIRSCGWVDRCILAGAYAADGRLFGYEIADLPERGLCVLNSSEHPVALEVQAREASTSIIDETSNLKPGALATFTVSPLPRGAVVEVAAEPTIATDARWRRRATFEVHPPHGDRLLLVAVVPTGPPELRIRSLAPQSLWLTGSRRKWASVLPEPGIHVSNSTVPPVDFRRVTVEVAGIDREWTTQDFRQGDSWLIHLSEAHFEAGPVRATATAIDADGNERTKTSTAYMGCTVGIGFAGTGSRPEALVGSRNREKTADTP